MISEEHAVVWFETGMWWIKDLGSLNGTRVDGEALERGGVVRLRAGSVIELGDAAQAFMLESAAPPTPRAVRLEDGHEIEARGGLLALPDEERASVLIHERAEGDWWLEEEDGERVVRDDQVVHAGGTAFRLQLPAVRERTLRGGSRRLRLPDVTLRLRVSRNEEHVEATVDGSGASVEIAPRAHLFAVLQLARLRLGDAPLSEGERGWIDRETLARQLGLDRLALNVQLYRARRQLADAGVENAAELIERRPTAGEIRLNVARVSVASLDEGHGEPDRTA